MTEPLAFEGHQSPEQMELPPSVFRYEGEYSEYLERLQDTLAITEEDKEAIEGLVDGASHKLRLLLIDGKQQRAVTHVASAYKWLLAASPREELPASLIVTANLAANDASRYCVQIDQRDPLLDDTNPIEDILHECGIGDAGSYKARLLGQRQDDITEIFADYAHASAASTFIQSFEQPRQANGDAVLTPFWKQVRQTHIEDGVRKHYGMATHDEFMPGTSARRELGRLLFQLDDETMPNPSAAPQTGIERFEAYASQLLHNVLREQGLTIVRMETNINEDSGAPHHWVKVHCRDEDGNTADDVYIDEWLDDLTRITARDAGVDLDNPFRGVDDNILYEALRNVLYPALRPNFGTLDELLTQISVQTATLHAFRLTEPVIVSARTLWNSEVSQIARYMEPTYSGGPYDEIELGRLLRKRHSEYSGVYDPWGGVFASKRTSITSRESQEKLRRHTFGYVEQPGIASQAPMRLVIQGNTDVLESLPRGVPEYDLKLTVAHGQEDQRQHHYIPGYKLVGLDAGLYARGEYYYALDTDGDPYARCDVAVDAGKLHELVEYYESIGIDTAPFLQKAATGATVQNIVNGIRAIADYVYADDSGAVAMTTSFNNDRQFDKEPESFGKLVRNGRLQVQCTGAAAFLHHSLGILFGPACSLRLSGNVITAGASRIDGVGHAQVMFHHDGFQFILDATPSSGDSRDWDQSQALDGIAPRKIPQDDQPHYPTLIAQSLNVPEIVVPEKSVDERVQELVEGLKGMLRLFNDARSDDELFQKLLKLPESDPMRATLQTVLSNEAGTSTPRTTPAATLNYLELCLTADGAARRRVGIDSYANAMIEQLASYTRRYISLRTPD